MNRVTIIVPCYNEVARLDRRAFLEALSASPNLELLFVDDGSNDGTGELLEVMASQIGARRATVLRLAQNVGKAEAVRRGVKAILSEEPVDDLPTAFGYWDADLSTGLEELPRFEEVLESNPETLAVIGSRVRLAGREIKRNAIRHYGGRAFATLAAIALGFAVYDTQCGAKVFRLTPAVSASFERPFRAHWAFDVELLARLTAAAGAGCIVELPLVRWSDVAGSKVRFRDLPWMLIDLLHIFVEYRVKGR